jgi:hypothetical protein
LPVLAYVSQGSLYLWRQGAQPKRVESAFATQVRERAAAIDRKHAWKGKDRERQFRSMIWSRDSTSEQAFAEVWVADVSASEGRVFYALRSGRVSGVFRIDADDEDAGVGERRLFHTTDLGVDDLGGVETHGYLACSLSGEKGASHIGVLHEDGGEVTELTAGDSMDRAPRWVSGKDRVLVYQSAGISRDERGHVMYLAPSVIQQLDISEGRLDLALALPGYDLLAPKVDAEGALYCLRRRYRDPNKGQGWSRLLRLVMSPIWLLYALLIWLGVFIQTYTGRRMIEPVMQELDGDGTRVRMRSGGPESDREDSEDDNQPLAPAVLEQELIKVHKDGKVEMLTRGVVEFDLGADGTLICTDGRSVFMLDSQRERTELFKAKYVSRLQVIGTRG